MTDLLRTEATRVLARVRTAIVDHERWPGQLNPEGFAHALALDMRGANAAAGDEIGFPDHRMVEAARDLAAAFGEEGASFNLPFGTRVTVGRPGSVEIAGRVYVKRRKLPGMHPIETTQRDAHGSNLESLRGMLYNRGSSSSCRRFGLPSPAIVGDGRARHVIEFPTLAEVGGAVLQYDVEEVDAARFCAAPWLSLEGFCKTMVQETQWLWRHRAAIARRVEEVRRAAEASIEAARWGVHAVVVGRILIDGGSIGRADAPTLLVEYVGRDHALRRGRLFDVVAGDNIAILPCMLRAPFVDRYRGAQADRLWDLGADGWIDAPAAAIARAATEGEAAVLLRLALNLETLVSMSSPAGQLYATLFWEDGVIRAEPAANGGLANLWQLHDRHGSQARSAALEMAMQMENICARTIPGERQEFGHDSHLRPNEGFLLVNTATGAIWPSLPRAI